ncbi:hypothetical protein [Terricaulis sp.]|uniref:hypothetical protein n=1 Tax=Terricaulis sp. TaxID=2768686 RepID=UPI00378506FC
MRNKGSRTIVTPVEDDPRGRSVTDLHDRGGAGKVDVLFDQKLFDRVIRRERSSAYWFAASLWGVSGLVLGAILGVYITLAVQAGSADIWRENFISGQAAREAADSVNSREPVLRREEPAQDQQP